jgi:hypothetical protein
VERLRKVQRAPMPSPKRLEQKLERIRAGTATDRDFILADAKDADMAFGIAATGPRRGQEPAVHQERNRLWKTRDEYLQQIRAIVQQDLVDIMLLSASNLERLAMGEGLFEASAVTPAARTNDTTDIWMVRGGTYASAPSRPFRTATLDHIKYGRLVDDYTAPATGTDLGLYSVTFTNQVDADHRTLEAFNAFRIEAERKRFRYFLEVFNPNVDPGLEPGSTGAFLNDQIVRCLAGVTSAGRPLFLKIPYHGPAALEELVSYDSSLVVGILGGSAGTTLDAFQLLHDAKAHGARVALFGRKINLSEDPLTFISYLRRIANAEITPIEAVKAYHAELARLRIGPHRPLADDLQLTQSPLNAR